MPKLFLFKTCYGSGWPVSRHTQIFNGNTLFLVSAASEIGLSQTCPHYLHSMTFQAY